MSTHSIIRLSPFMPSLSSALFPLPSLPIAAPLRRPLVRSHLYQLCSRQLLAGSGKGTVDVHREYGIYLGQGAVLTLTTADMHHDGRRVTEDKSLCRNRMLCLCLCHST